MKQSTLTSKTISIIKLFFFCFFGVIFIVASSIALKKLCLSCADASDKEYVLFLAPTPLYTTSDCKNELITLPEGYYATLLNKTDNLVRVEYNGVTGFLRLEENTKVTNECENPPYQTAEIKTSHDSGTHLRILPTTESTSLVTIPADSTLTYIGEISGIRPSDGTSNKWYYVHFDSGATTTHTGYVYSERIEIISGKEDRPLSNETASTNTSTPSTKNEELSTPLVTTPISAGLKIFLTILFSTLGIIIFALLIISPREKKESRQKMGNSQSDSYVKIYDKNSNIRNKNGDFIPKNAQELTILQEKAQKSSKNNVSMSEFETDVPKNTTKETSLNIIFPAQNAREAKKMQKHSKNTQSNNNLTRNSYKNEPRMANTEFSNFMEFDQPTYHQSLHGHIQNPKHEKSRKQELHLIGEKKGAPLPRVLQRYFDLDD